MKLEVKVQLLKFCSQVLNSVFLALGLSVAGCAVWILFGGGNLLTALHSVELRTVGAGLLLIGGVVVLVTVIGCVGTDGENRFLLLVHLGLLIILILGQLFVTLLLLISQNRIKQSLDQTVDDIIVQYGRHSRDRLMDDVQNSEKCCGRTGPADWLKNSHIQSLNLTNPHVLPCSCFSSSWPSLNSSWCSDWLDFPPPLYGRGNASYTRGCQTALSDWLQGNVVTVVGMDVALVLIQVPLRAVDEDDEVLQFVVTVYLYRAFGSKASLRRTTCEVDPDPAHLDQVPEAELDYGDQNYAYEDSDEAFVNSAHPAQYHDYPSHLEPSHLAHHHGNQEYD